MQIVDSYADLIITHVKEYYLYNGIRFIRQMEDEG